MVASTEFRNEALRRTEQKHGRRGTDDLYRTLLDDIYRDLYGRSTPTRDEYESDLRDLENCLDSRRNQQPTCERLGRNLVGHRLFYDQNADLIDRVEDGGGRRDRGRDRDRGRRFR
jgi:hypothetical protein